ncbi:hypothetical protein B0J18DRAFT_428484 [Chaetomium sp. MPI-SDFR-AT-0129]|nr:hypothetical protein B0J18DRAFT_428484 [Chaetomium sp. MPI-SDFR-AT-0129]
MLSTTVLITGLLAALTQASPVLQRRDGAVGGVLICSDPNGQGVCQYNVYELEKCYNLPQGLVNNAATFAPDDAPFYCYPYLTQCGGICTSPTGCTFGAVSYDYENKYNLTKIGWNEYITSFECHLNQTTTASP